MTAPVIEHAFGELYEDLDEYLIGDVPDRVEDHDGAERMMRAVARAARERDRIVAMADALHARIDEWKDAQLRRCDTSYLEGCLTDYHARLLEQDPKAKTIHLPSGDLTSRAGQPHWEIDPEPFLAWADIYGTSLIRVRKEPALAEIKVALRPDLERGVAVDQAGEMVPGVRVLPAETSFRVKVGEP